MKFVGLGRRRNECGVPWMEENTRTGGERLFDWIWTWLRLLQMARWDEILTLPVQSPPTLEFSAVDIVWSRWKLWNPTKYLKKHCIGALFGPDDHREGGVVSPRQELCCKEKRLLLADQIRRGMCVHFIVKRLIAEPSVAPIIYNQDKHVDKRHLVMVPRTKKAARTYAMFAPCFSDELSLQIMSLLYVGVPVKPSCKGMLKQ
ncbi:hypothetical protein HPP92_013482 [Vanilla planifolia]|uniref:Uncharacterized protein n=1 Tax=Vanilla planifolia TaxID=51239 RepID=A0A835UYV1_VANPL|nr:hypothetical protein HPP92_013482 [Vanilla planifolia]